MLSCEPPWVYHLTKMPRSQSNRRKAQCTQRKKRSTSPVRGVSHSSRRAKRRLYCKLQLWMWRKRRERCGSWILRARRRARKLCSASLLRMKTPPGKNKSSVTSPVECDTGGSEDRYGGQKSPLELCESWQNAVTDTNVSEGSASSLTAAGLSQQKATSDSSKDCPSVKLQNDSDVHELTPHSKKASAQVQAQRPECDSPSGPSPSVSACWDLTANGETDEKSKRAASLQSVVSFSVLKNSIHEFLDGFYRVYGSFIPLHKSSVLAHLKRRFKTDFSDRTSVILAEVSKCKTTITQRPAHSFQIVYKKHTLTLDDLSTLADQNWLNDQVMNMYGELIMESAHHKVHFLNSFFHRQLMTKGYDGVKRWTKQVDLFSKRLLLVPIHLEVHWCLVSADIAKKRICLYDSQGISLWKVARNILRYLMTEAKDKKQTAFESGWAVVHDEKVPQQTNENDCGVFVLEYSRRLALGKALLFSQKDIPMIRKRIYKELCDCELREDS